MLEIITQLLLHWFVYPNYLWFLQHGFLFVVLPEFCISEKMSTLQVVSLDYIVVLFPLKFTAVIYMLIEVHDRGFKPLFIPCPFHKCLFYLRRSWNIKGLLIKASATFYALSFTKVVSMTVSLMLTASMFDVCGTVYWTRLYNDASCGLFQKCHHPYGILSMLIFAFFIIVPTSYFLFYPGHCVLSIAVAVIARDSCCLVKLSKYFIKASKMA